MIEQNLREIAAIMTDRNSFSADAPTKIYQAYTEMVHLRTTLRIAMEDVMHAQDVMEGITMPQALKEELRASLDCIYDRLIGGVWPPKEG